MTNEEKRKITFEGWKNILEAADCIPVLLIGAHKDGRVVYVPCPAFKLDLLPQFMNEAARQVGEVMGRGN